jgi:tRNA U34 5-carboxymethylaminomethyl modifying enzyme MnmG/GidA
MAGINAHLKVKEKAPLILKRGLHWVLIDDLITKELKNLIGCLLPC